MTKDSSGIVYADVREARRVLESRAGLRGRVESWWKGNGWGEPALPAGDGPLAVLARQVPTFRYEDGAFVLLARRAGLRPSWFALTSDRHSDRSPYKRGLVAPRFCCGRGKGGEPEFVRYSVSPVGDPAARRERLSAVRLRQDRWPELRAECGLVEFHRRQLLECYPDAVLGDNTPWLGALGGAEQYYLPFLSLFVAHAVLFEDFGGGESGNDGLAGFTRRVVAPAFDTLLERLGVCPLVVKMPWTDEMSLYPTGPDWRCHGIVSPPGR